MCYKKIAKYELYRVSCPTKILEEDEVEVCRKPKINVKSQATNLRTIDNLISKWTDFLSNNEPHDILMLHK